jgi:hypothetical protein
MVAAANTASEVGKDFMMVNNFSCKTPSVSSLLYGASDKKVLKDFVKILKDFPGKSEERLLR